MQPVPRPRGPHDLRASDADRERVVATLREAAADGRLTVDEHGQRMERAYACRTLGELAVLTSDLTEDPLRQPVQPAMQRVLAIAGSGGRHGRWVVPAKLPVTAVFGEVKLDLREALLERREVTINATAILGEVSIVVPEGVEVRVSGPAILGTRSSRIRGPFPPERPVVHLRCFVLLGQVTAKPSRRRRWFHRLRRR